MPFTDQHKEELERRIVETIIQALEKGEVKQSDLSEVATVVLEKVDQLENQDQVAEFMTELSVRWPIFKPILQIELGKIKSELEKRVAHEVLRLANSGDVEAAIRLAKTMTEQQE